MGKIKNLWLVISVIIVIAVLVGLLRNPVAKNIDEKREDFVSQKEDMIGELIGEGNYKCCLEKACTYCIEKTPGHGEGATCNCLKDVVEGMRPCGECTGEILEGHGNPYLAEYFAKAIAEKTGHEDAIKEIIFEKYGMPVEEQA